MDALKLVVNFKDFLENSPNGTILCLEAEYFTATCVSLKQKVSRIQKYLQ